MNRWYLSAAAALVALSLAGCAQQVTHWPVPQRFHRKSATKIPLAFVTHNVSDFWLLCRQGAEDAAKELGDVDLKFVMPQDGTAATQKRETADLVAKGIRGVAISPVDPIDETPLLNELAAKTPLITCDSDAPASNRLCYIGTDNVAAGVMAGKLIREAIPKGGKIVLFVGKRDAQNAMEREAGIRKALAGSNVTVADVLTDDADRVKAKANATRALSRYPDIAGLVGLWSYNTPAIVAALKDASKLGKVAVVGFDQEVATIDGLRTGTVYGTVIQNPYQFGYQSITMLDRLAHGDRSDLPKSGLIIVPTRTVKSADVSSLFVK